MEESQNETINISDTVAEITSVISKHLIKVIEQVSSKNNDASQNMEILNQLPIVKNLKSENEKLKQELQTLQEKYKSTLLQNSGNKEVNYCNCNTYNSKYNVFGHKRC